MGETRRRARVGSEALLLFACAGSLLMAACASSPSGGAPGRGAPRSLYKTAAGRDIAHRSYDETMELWAGAWQDDWIETSYGRTHAVVAGPGGGKPVFLLPGMFGDACMWFANGPALSAEYRVIALDNISYAGKSEPSERQARTDSDYAAWLGEIADHYCHRSFALAGMSYGGWMTAALCRLMPERISAAILIDPAVTFQATSREFENKGLATFLFFPSRKKTGRFFSWLGGGVSRPDIDLWNEHLLDCVQHGASNPLTLPRSKVYTAGELSMATMPVLVLVAGKPVIYKSPASYEADAKRLLPLAETVLIPETAHAMQMEKAPEVNALIIDFLGRRYL